MLSISTFPFTILPLMGTVLSLSVLEATSTSGAGEKYDSLSGMRGRTSGISFRLFSITAANSAMVGYLNISSGLIRMPAWRALFTTLMVEKEAPPNWKKLSWTPIFLISRISFHMFASLCLQWVAWTDV